MSKANPNQRRLDRHPAHQETLDPDRRAEPSPKVDPLELMESAARLHWRAAAWLLERTRPEEYGRKSASAAPRRQVEAALLHVLEAALEGTLPEQRDAVDGRVFAACQRAFASCFPAIAALAPFKLPGELCPGPPPAEVMLSPKTHEATENECGEELNHDGATSTAQDNAEPVTPPSNAAEACSASPADIVSPKIAKATECPTSERPATELPLLVESPPAAVAETQLLNLQRHAALRRRAALLSRKQQAATKRQKRAAKKRAQAARKRAA